MLSAVHLGRRFGERVAVDDVSFELGRGQILALLGPNGAGKTTTLRMLAGLIEPTSGDVHLDGHPLGGNGGARLRGRVGFLTEAPGLWDKLTVAQNLEVYARLHGLASPRQVVAAALELFDIRDRATERTASLSKGLKQRVALARTLLHDPAIVLLDEPTSGLDPESARTVRSLMVRLREQGRAVLVSTHNLDEVERVADRVAVLRTKLVAVDTPAALRARLFGTRLRIVVTGAGERFAGLVRDAGFPDLSVDGSSLSIRLRDGASIPDLVRRLVAAGADVEAVVPDAAPLEEVYLRLLEHPEGES